MKEQAPREDPGAPTGDVVLRYDPPFRIWDEQRLAQQGCYRVDLRPMLDTIEVVCPHEPSDEDIREAIEADRQYRLAHPERAV